PSGYETQPPPNSYAQPSPNTYLPSSYSYMSQPTPNSYLPPPPNSYTQQPPPNSYMSQPPTVTYMQKPSTIVYMQPPSTVAYVMPPSTIAYEPPPVYYKPTPTTPEYIAYPAKPYAAAIPVEPNTYAAVIPVEPYKQEYNTVATNAYSLNPNPDGYALEPYKQELNVYATNTYAAPVPVDPYKPEYVAAPPRPSVYAHPPYYSPAPSKAPYAMSATLIYVGDKSHGRHSAGAQTGYVNTYAAGEYYASYSTHTPYTHIPPSYSASSLAITIALPVGPSYTSPTTTPPPHVHHCSSCNTAAKRTTSVEKYPAPSAETAEALPLNLEYQIPRPPPAPQCTWNKVQINDPTTWDPVPTYPYSSMPKNIPTPGKIDPDVLRIVGQLTLKEKIGQMTQIEVGQLIDCNGELNHTAVEYWIDEWKVGSFLETPANHGGKYNWYSPKTFGTFTDAVQKIALERGSKIPVIWGLDSVRGANYVKGATIFPAGIATAATFNPQFAYDAGRIAAKDTRAAGVHWAFAPILDLAVNKLWSRTYENFGEDPYLASKMGAASVNGYQGDYKHDRSRVAACMKHFIGYGYPFDGSDRANRHIAAHELLEYYVPPFKAAIDAGVATAMESYGVVNGEPVVMSFQYLQGLLREQLGFKGMLVTDWGEINSQATMYKTASNIEQATWATLNRTSVDMSMVAEDTSFAATTFDLVIRGVIPEERIDESAARILQLKKDLGLFESPFADCRLQATVGSAQDIEAARNSARESITLLKNTDNVLPLRQSDRVLFVGPTLNSTRYMGGGWNIHWQGPSDAEGDAIYQGFGDTVLQGVQRITGVEPDYFKGVDIDGIPLTDIGAIIEAAKEADKIVIGLGERTYAEFEGNIGNLTLPDGQLNLVYTLAKATAKPIVVVLIEGRPRILGNVVHAAAAIVNAYLPGAYGGLPIAEILYGLVNPSGRLPYTYPATESQASTTIWQSSFSNYDPQWAFGFGMSYSQITYSNVTLSSNVLRPGAPITATINITNKGPRAQKETVMLFTNQPYRFDLAPDHLRLRAFDKVHLAVGETKKVTLELKAEDLAFWTADLKKNIAPSPVNIVINPYNQADIFATVQVLADSDRLL
ncbi:hypothetical protein GGI13_003401, partial [Coemansia sp. RSA 455]